MKKKTLSLWSCELGRTQCNTGATVAGDSVREKERHTRAYQTFMSLVSLGVGKVAGYQEHMWFRNTPLG